MRLFFTKKNYFLTAIISIISFATLVFLPVGGTLSVRASDYSFIILSTTYEELNIGDTLYLSSFSTGKGSMTYRSSNSSVASVDNTGTVTAKKAGSAVITVKCGKSSATCTVKVRKTTITLSKPKVSMDVGASALIYATASRPVEFKWKSSAKKVATVDDRGRITAVAPGKATITASADGVSAKCEVTVKKPTMKLSDETITLYRNGTATIFVTSTSTSEPVFKSNKKSVAVVDSTGTVTAIKHGQATITVTVDGVCKTCDVYVNQPTITLNKTSITLHPGDTFKLNASVSSGNTPQWSSSNAGIVTVGPKGKVTAHEAGKAYIYAAEDGVKVRCTVTVKP